MRQAKSWPRTDFQNLLTHLPGGAHCHRIVSLGTAWPKGPGVLLRPWVCFTPLVPIQGNRKCLCSLHTARRCLPSVGDSEGLQQPGSRNVLLTGTHLCLLCPELRLPVSTTGCGSQQPVHNWRSSVALLCLWAQEPSNASLSVFAELQEWER